MSISWVKRWARPKSNLLVVNTSSYSINKSTRRHFSLSLILQLDTSVSSIHEVEESEVVLPFSLRHSRSSIISANPTQVPACILTGERLAFAILIGILPLSTFVTQRAGKSKES